MFYIDVILPIPLKQTFTYSVNKDEAGFLKQGHRVAVPFGKSKVYTAIVYQVHDQAPEGYKTKSIDQILDQTPIITPQQIKHWQWMASYYMCTLGEIVKAALPSAFLLESETVVSLCVNAAVDPAKISDEAYLVIEALQQRSPLHINDVRAVLDSTQVVKVLKDLLDLGVIEVQEEMYEQYTPKLKKYIKVASLYQEQEQLSGLLESLSRAPKQKEILLQLFSLQAQTKKAVGVTSFQKASGAGPGAIKALVKKGILEEFYLKKDRIDYKGDAPQSIMDLSDAQQQAHKEINTCFKEQDVVLLHGVTASGKTEIYIKLIEQQLSNDKQVLFMLPEIALTTQLISRLQYYFGEKIGVYHSKYSVNERVELWNNVLQNKAKAQIIIGARSSLFLPFSNLGLIVVDEAHEPSFKQYNPAPRYQARDSAIVLARIHQGKLLMGSAFVFLLSIFLAANGVNAIFSAFEYSYHVKINRGFFKQYAVALGVSVLFAVALIITVVIILYGEYGIRDLQGRAFLSEDVFWLSALQLTAFVVLLYSTISTLYYFGTKEGKKSKFFSLGALVTTLLFLATTYFFGIYINNFSTYNELYGSLGALLIMLLYIWINSNLLLLGFELNITLQRLRNKQNELN